MDEADIIVKKWSGVRGGFMRIQAYHPGLNLEGQPVVVTTAHAKHGEKLAILNLMKEYERRCS